VESADFPQIHASRRTAARIDINLPPCIRCRILPSLETVHTQIRAGEIHCRSRGDRDIPDNARAIARNRVNCYCVIRELHGESRVGLRFTGIVLGKFLGYLHSCHNVIYRIRWREGDNDMSSALPAPRPKGKGETNTS